MEDRVEAEVAEAELVGRGLELRLAVGADQGAGIIRADRQIVEAIDRLLRAGDIDRDDALGRGVSG